MVWKLLEKSHFNVGHNCHNLFSLWSLLSQLWKPISNFEETFLIVSKHYGQGVKLGEVLSSSLFWNSWNFYAAKRNGSSTREALSKLANKMVFSIMVSQIDKSAKREGVWLPIFYLLVLSTNRFLSNRDKDQQREHGSKWDRKGNLCIERWNLASENFVLYIGRNVVVK